MSLRDFIFRRKPAGSQGASRSAAVLAEANMVPQSLCAPVDSVDDRGTVLRLEPSLQVADVAVPMRSGCAAPRHEAVLRRFAAVTLAADAGGAARSDAILARLCIVHDPSEVVLSGSDRSAQIVMVNRRLMSARFCKQGGVDVVFNFLKKAASKRAARDFSASLAGFCAGPVDLVMTERAISGVFYAAAGLAVSDLVAEAGAEQEPEAEFAPQAAAG